MDGNTGHPDRNATLGVHSEMADLCDGRNLDCYSAGLGGPASNLSNSCPQARGDSDCVRGDRIAGLARITSEERCDAVLQAELSRLKTRHCRKGSKSVWHAAPQTAYEPAMSSRNSCAKGIVSMSLPKESFKSNQPSVSRRSLCMALVSGAALLPSGCLGLASNLMHAVGMDMIPPEYEGFEEKTVAVITISDSSSYTRDQKSAELSSFVGKILNKHIKNIQIVRNDKISHWRDTNGWDSLDFTEIGAGVEADKVLGIELGNFSLRDGPTLYCGCADVTITVIDVATGEVEYTKSLDEYTYPTLAGQHTSETTESRFRKLYLNTLAEEIGRAFHPYDLSDRVAADSRIASS